MSGPTRIGAAITAIIGAWIVMFWLAPAHERRARVTFGAGPDNPFPEQNEPIVDPIAAPRKPDAPDNAGPSLVKEASRATQSLPADEAASETEMFIVYIVSAGDTLASIGARFYDDAVAGGSLRRANPTVNFDEPLREGTALRVPIAPGP